MIMIKKERKLKVLNMHEKKNTKKKIMIEKTDRQTNTRNGNEKRDRGKIMKLKID